MNKENSFKNTVSSIQQNIQYSKKNPKDFFGRRRGRPLRAEGKKHFEKLIFFHPSRLDSWPNKVILDIGFGYGEHFLHSLCHRSEYHHIGVEVFENALAHVMENIPEEHYNSCSIIPDSIQKSLDYIGDIDEVWVLFPDPWPKKKHQKRRLIQEDFIKKIALKIKSTGKFIIASDHMDLLSFIYEEIEKTNLFTHREGWNLHHIQNILYNYNIIDHWGNLCPKYSNDEQLSCKENSEKISAFLDEKFLGPSWPWVLTRYGHKAKKEGRPLGWFVWEKNN